MLFQDIAQQVIRVLEVISQSIVHNFANAFVNLDATCTTNQLVTNIISVSFIVNLHDHTANIQ